MAADYRENAKIATAAAMSGSGKRFVFGARGIEKYTSGKFNL